MTTLKIFLLLLLFIVKISINYSYFLSSLINNKLQQNKLFYQLFNSKEELPEIENMPIKTSDGMYADHEIFSDVKKIEVSLTSFREYVKKGLNLFMQGELSGAIEAMDIAATFNATQPLQQRGIMLYIAEQYDAAEEQLKLDIEKFEKMKTLKASELRLWRSACLYKLNRPEEAKAALDVENNENIPVRTQSLLINCTLLYFHGSFPIEDMISFIGDPLSEKDIGGISFFGNLFIGLYLDAIGESGLSQVFLSIPNTSEKFPKQDMWYHVPRVLYKKRFGDSVDQIVNSAGMIIS